MKKKFYGDQLLLTKFWISEEVDECYEKGRKKLMLLSQQHQQDPEEVDPSNKLNDVSVCTENSVNVNVSISRYMD